MKRNAANDLIRRSFLQEKSAKTSKVGYRKKKEKLEFNVMEKDERVDILSIKNQLMEKLSEPNQQKYWEVMRKFFQAKLSKIEFDSVAKKALGEANIHLHNQLILGSLKNALGLRAISKAPLENSLIQRKRLSAKNLLANQKKNLAKRKRSEKHDSLTIAPKKMKLLENKYKIGKESEYELVGSPSLLFLKQRMMKFAAQSGVSEVSNDAVKFMMDALECHLKEIMTNTLNTDVDNCKTALNARDLLDAVKMNPLMMGDSLPYTREKLLLM